MTIWKDRSRWLGMPLRSTSYELNGNKLYLRRGYISNNEEQLLLHRVVDMSLREGIIDKLCNQGTLILRTTDTNNETVYLYNITNVKEVRDLLSEIIEDERIRLGVVSREYIGYSNPYGGD